jgi:LysR family glycine cleavage system transcriptional activator
MYSALPSLNALRAFEAAARHLSMSVAATELHVTPSALSHQIRGLEDYLGVRLFERRVRAIELTAAGKMLHPGLQAGFTQIRDAVAGLQIADNPHVLVISTPPGFTAKWLAPRLYRFSSAYTDIDARVSSSSTNANFVRDGVDVAIRNLPIGHTPEVGLVVEKLIDIEFLPVCTPALLAKHGPFDSPTQLANVPLIHDETFSDRANMPRWTDWLAAAGADELNVSRGLRFNSADHALDAAVEGAGVLLAHGILAHDDLKSGRLIAPFPLALTSGRAYHLVYPEIAAKAKNVIAFSTWIKEEVAAMKSGSKSRP